MREAKQGKGLNENVEPCGQAFFLCGFEDAELSGESVANESKRSDQPPAQHNISGDNSLRVPPVPIPNTEVKPQHADGTWLATARESRSSPDSILFADILSNVRVFLCPDLP